MSRKKKSFVLYFDSFLSIAPLAPEQRGWLLSAIFTYAMKAAEQPELPAEQVLSDFPALEPEARMACRFICAAIQRDTHEWNCRYRPGPSKQSAPAGDTGWMKQYMPRREDT